MYTCTSQNSEPWQIIGYEQYKNKVSCIIGLWRMNTVGKALDYKCQTWSHIICTLLQNYLYEAIDSLIISRRVSPQSSLSQSMPLSCWCAIHKIGNHIIWRHSLDLHKQLILLFCFSKFGRADIVTAWIFWACTLRLVSRYSFDQLKFQGICLEQTSTLTMCSYVDWKQEVMIKLRETKSNLAQ